MREARRSVAIAALVATSFLAPTASYAEPTPTPSPTSTRTPLEQFKIDRQVYLDSLKERSQQIKAINIIFKESCEKAVREYRNSMASARTPDQKNIAATLRKNAVTAAIVARDLAITALGPEPIQPVEPSKPLKVSSKKKQR